MKTIQPATALPSTTVPVIIDGTDTNIVDGLPVYNAWVVIKGSYAGRADAQHFAAVVS